MIKTMKRAVSALLAAVLCMALLTGCSAAGVPGGPTGMNGAGGGSGWSAFVASLGADGEVRPDPALNTMAGDVLDLAEQSFQGQLDKGELWTALQGKYPDLENSFARYVYAYSTTEAAAMEHIRTKYPGSMRGVTRFGVASRAVSLRTGQIWVVVILGA